MSAITSEKRKGAESRVLSSLASDRGIHHYLPHAVKLTALVAFAWSVLKIVLIAKTYGLFVAVVFAGLHLPLCLFSALFVLWLFDLNQGLGFLALASALLNAVLI